MDMDTLKSQLTRAENALNELYERLAETKKTIETLKTQQKNFPAESDEYLNISGTIYLLGISERTIGMQIKDLENRIAEIGSEMKGLETEQAK